MLVKKRKRKRKKRKMTTSVGPNERRVRETLYHFRRPGHTFANERPCPAAVNSRKMSSSFSSLAKLLVTIISDNSFPFSFTS